MKMTGAAILVKELEYLKVKTVFGYPGGYVLHIYDELYAAAGSIRHILTAGEQGASFAADAYARVSGKTGVVIATGGPGATNLITGIACSYLDSVPMVYITGNVPVPMLGQDAFQDIDIIGVTMPIVKHSYVVKDIADLQKCVREAFYIANHGRKGPVHIDIPKNVQTENYVYNRQLQLLPDAMHFPAFNRLPSVFESQIDNAVRLILQSKRPFIYCGGGVTATMVGSEIIMLSKMLSAPIGLSMMGLGSVPYSYERNLGMSGMHGRYASVKAMSEADLIIAAGVRFSDRATGSAGEYQKDTAVIHIDIDEAEIGKNIYANINLCGDLREILPPLMNRLITANYSKNPDWDKRVRELKSEDDYHCDNEFTPRNIVCTVNDFYGSDIIVTTDVGQHQMWVAQHYKFEKPRTFISSGGLGCMGYGLGAAIGASIAMGGKRVILFTGDGSFGMNLSELSTAVELKLPLTIILLNNGTLGMVRQWQTLFFKKRYSNTTISRATNFPAVAGAFGAAGFSVCSIAALRETLKNIPSDRPSLIDCKIDIDEMVLPMIPPGGSIEDIIKGTSGNPE